MGRFGRIAVNMRRVLQYTRDFKLIKEFESITEAGISTKVDFRNIQKVCSGERKTAGGFIWRYIEQN